MAEERYASFYRKEDCFEIRVDSDFDEVVDSLKRHNNRVSSFKHPQRIVGGAIGVSFEDPRNPKKILEEFSILYSLEGGGQIVDAETRGERFSILTYPLDVDGVLLYIFSKYFFANKI